MSGFIKKNSNEHQDAFEVISSGIPTLDELIQLRNGSLTCIYEDENSFIHNTMLQIFISQSILLKSQIHAISMDPQYLRSFEIAYSNLKENEAIKNLVIAWRYQTLGPKKECSLFNLRESIPLNESIIVRDLEELVEIMKTTEKHSFAIFSLFSPLFESFDNLSLIHKWLFEIRKYSKLKRHCIFLSIPRFFIKDEIAQYFDNILSLNSIFALPHEKSIYNSILEITKMNTIGSLRVNTLDGIKYGLILKNRKIVIEKIDIPPEEDGPAADGCCSSAF